MDGCLVTYKPKELTSHDLVEVVRKSYKVRAGHAGTLDPMAQGVVLIFMGKGLKILHFLPHEYLDKTYLMRVTLGVSTNTYDATGEIVKESAETANISDAVINEAIKGFLGTTDQKPPAFSAVKVGGKRAYDLARAGAPPDLASRKVHVTSLKLIRREVMGGREQLIIRMHCSRGTYVRSFAHDLGEKLGCGAHLSYLLRERVGAWSHRQAFPLWRIAKKESFAENVAFVPLTQILPFPRIILNSGAEGKVEKGMALEPRDVRDIQSGEMGNGANGLIQVVAGNGELLAIYSNEPRNGVRESGRLSAVRVLASV